MKISFLVLSAVVVLSGCAKMSMDYKTSSAPISQVKANQVIEGKTTKTDLIAMFGVPNGIGQMGRVQTVMQPNSNIISWSDCTVGSRGRDASWSVAKAVGQESCKVLSVLLDDRGIVKASGYTNDYLITEAKAHSIKPNVSNKADVVRLLAGPTSITPSGSDDIWVYKNCRNEAKHTGSFMALNNRFEQIQKCQQASFVIAKTSGVVTKVFFSPFQ